MNYNSISPHKFPRRNFYDGHTHSELSDGNQTWDQVCRNSVITGIGALGATDHDVLMPWAEAQRLSQKWSMDVIPGVELSSQTDLLGKKTTLHLGIHWLPDNGPGVAELLRHNQKQPRDIYIKAMLYRLWLLGMDPSGKGVDASYQMILERTPNSLHRGKRFVADLLVDTGCVPTRKEAMQKYLGTQGQRLAYVDQTHLMDYAPLEWVMEVVHKNPGAVVTLNHPYYYRLEQEQLDELMKRFHDLGGHAVEVVYPKHDQTRRIQLLSYCQQYDFMLNAGSDRHDEGKPFLQGDPMIYETLYAFHLQQVGDYIGKELTAHWEKLCQQEEDRRKAAEKEGDHE